MKDRGRDIREGRSEKESEESMRKVRWRADLAKRWIFGLHHASMSTW